ncbi:hypothetical protein MTR_7g090350 [Medicago truncatula]|uniref:Uncharacterized protein n=1 Tax=Medicago truncatula TaxID=3880 RepID=G7KRP4_MEDTR|nr:hypothetical protein MTR_7g090350 [Medicago truncatula]
MLFQYVAELDAFLKFLIWRFSILDKPTPGIANLKYRDKPALQSRDRGNVIVLLPLFNSSLVKNLLRPFSKDKSSNSAEDIPFSQATPVILLLYCYYCLRTRCAAVPSFRCSRCSEPVVVPATLDSTPIILVGLSDNFYKKNVEYFLYVRYHKSQPASSSMIETIDLTPEFEQKFLRSIITLTMCLFEAIFHYFQL